MQVNVTERPSAQVRYARVLYIMSFSKYPNVYPGLLPSETEVQNNISEALTSSAAVEFYK